MTISWDANGYAYDVIVFGVILANGGGNAYVVNPTFNLISSIKYVSGSGTSENPIRISL